MKKIMIVASAIAFSVLAFAGPQQDHYKCDCLGDVGNNDGTCTKITGDSYRSGSYCEKEGGNTKDCYTHQCTVDSGIGGGGGTPAD